MNLDRKKFEKNLKKKGFRRDPAKDHIFYHHEYEGKKTGISTHFSHSLSEKDISDDLILLMKRELRLDSTKDVADLCNCPMSKEKYNGILKQKKLL